VSTRMVAFLRAINTGGRRLSNDQLLAPFRDHGLEEVAAYQAAGNVTFLADREPAALEAELEPLLHSSYGFDAPVFVRTSEELRVRVSTVPFDADEIAATEGRTQITFLASAPSSSQVDEVLGLVPADDRVEFVGREWFWLPRTGVSGSTLPVGKIERIVGPMTMRTVGTVERLLARLDG
jgi:uncharacterized protein (DUF1697 family)